jgi:hypothetical protein
VKRNARFGPLAVGALALSAFVAACGGDFISDPPLSAPGPRLVIGGEPGYDEVILCKVGPVGVPVTFTIQGSPAGVGIYTQGHTVQLTPMGDLSSACGTIWQPTAPADPTVALTITEIVEPGFRLELIAVLGGAAILDPADPSVTINVNWSNGAFVSFKNVPVETPPNGGGEGCTPGFWRQSQHFHHWTAPYTPSMLFVDAFEENAFPGMTLHQVVNLGGGDLNALGRHSVAALLNAASPTVSYQYTVADVIAAFGNAYNGTTTYESTKDLFEAFNEAGCSL